ncbi:hypothetical protein AAY473_023973, partial [Plecturocebus cupreus]
MTGSNYAAQAGLELLASNDLPTLVSQSAGITDFTLKMSLVGPITSLCSSQ